MPSNRIQIPFVVDTVEENPESSGKFVSRPVVGASVTVKNRITEAPTTVYATEKEAGAIVPTTDSNGKINGWVEEGAYIITVTGGKPFIAATVYNWDALSGRGIENGRVGLESVWKGDLRKDENHNDVNSVLEFLIPTGAKLGFGGEVAPAGFLLEDGKEYDTTEYNRLFKVIGYKFGGAGSKFAVPDSRGRVNVGAGSGPGLTVRTIGEKSGTETVILTTGQLASHSHTQTSVGGSANVSGSVNGTLSGTISDHSHQPPSNLGGRSYMNHAEPGDESAAPRYLSKDSSGETQVLWGNAGWGGATGSINGTVGCSVNGTLGGSMSGTITTNTGTTSSTGSGEAHSNMQPFLVCTGIIKT